MLKSTDVSEVIAAYLGRFPDRREYLRPLRELIDGGADVLSRSEFRGHVTCGAVTVGWDGRVLLVRHKALDRWLMPGGHAEKPDRSLRDGAVRELCEEAGVRTSQIDLPWNWLDVPVHVDRHPIPANPRKNEPGHDHWDFQFLIRLASDEVRSDENEVTDWRWERAGVHSPHLARSLEFAQAWEPLSAARTDPARS